MSWKRRGVYVAVSIVVISCALFLVQSLVEKNQRQAIADPSLYTAHLNGVPLELEIARNSEEHKRGLSGRQELLDGKGMLFVFSEDGQYGFWMHDMHFSIDILWLDSFMRVVYIKKSVSPESYPTVFTPEEMAHYVLEVPAGWTEKHGIVEGNILVIEKK